MNGGTILGAFHEEVRFNILWVVAVGLAIWLVIRARTRAARRRLQDRFDVRNAERERIARALHDTLFQSVQGLILRFQAVVDDLSLRAIDRQRIEEALDQADALIHEGRMQVQALRIATQLPADAESLRRVLSHPEGRTVSGNERALKPEVAAELLRIAEEAVRNGHRHGRASAIEVSLRIASDEVLLRILDDGVGIAPEFIEAGREGHFGLIGMRERAAQLSGTFLVARRAEGGTEVAVTVPGRIAYHRSRFAPAATIRDTWKLWTSPRSGR